jgi:hypothetical protein
MLLAVTPTWLRLVRTTDRVDLREHIVEVSRGWIFGGALMGSGADLDGAVPAAVRTILRIDEPVRSSRSELSASAATTTFVGSMLPGQHQVRNTASPQGLGRTLRIVGRTRAVRQ